MDGSNSKFLLNKCTLGVHGEADRDRISQLPDEIVIEIVSFLPLREAAATSILSSRWKDFWKHTCNLDFNTTCLNFNTPESGYSYAWELTKRRNLIELVNSVLQSHKALSLKQFRISLCVKNSDKHAVAKWLEFVFSRRVESLALDFQTPGDKFVLKEVLRESNISPFFFKSLKSLSLECFKMSGEDIKLFLHNCPLLERLIIRSAYVGTDVEVCGANLVLSHLDMTNCIVRGCLRVSAPNLTWLGIDTRSTKLLLENNSPKLVGASFVYSCWRPCDAQRFTSAISCYISQLKVLHLTLSSPQVVLASGITEFPNLNKLSVYCFGACHDSLMAPVTALIWASPRLQEFEIEFINIMIEERGRSVEVIANVERSPHQHLKVFKFRRLYGLASNHFELVTFVSNNCAVLQKIIIGYELFTFPAEDSKRRGQGRTAGNKYIKQLRGQIPRHIRLHLFQM